MQNLERIHTGISGLDAMLHGGLLPQTVNLIEGAPGCGKSTLGMQFIYEGAQHGEPGIILTFEELPQQFYRDAASFGWDFRDLERRGLLKVIMSSPEVTQADLEHVNGAIEQTVAEMGTQRILIDSITHIEANQPKQRQRRENLYGLLNSFKRQNLTAMMTRETGYLFGESQEEQDNSSIHFIADAYIMLHYVEIESAIQRAIIVLKTRGSDHDSMIRRFEIDHQGIHVRKPFEGQEGIMSGTPKRMEESFIKAFIKNRPSP